MAHPSLWWDPDAPDPLSAETLDTLEKNHAYKTTAVTDVKMGYQSVTTCLDVFGWALGSIKTMA